MRRIVAGAVEPVLTTAGFEKVKGARLSWIRREAELQHVIALLVRYRYRHVQWGVVCPEATPVLWDRECPVGDVGYAVMTGTLAFGQSFELEDSNDPVAIDEIIRALAEDLSVVEQRLRAFATRRELREYLMENRDQKDRRDFVIPSGFRLKLLTAATLAVVDRDPEACDLVAETEREMTQLRDRLSLGRLERLKSAAADLCGPR